MEYLPSRLHTTSKWPKTRPVSTPCISGVCPPGPIILMSSPASRASWSFAGSFARTAAWMSPLATHQKAAPTLKMKRMAWIEQPWGKREDHRWKCNSSQDSAWGPSPPSPPWPPCQHRVLLTMMSWFLGICHKSIYIYIYLSYNWAKQLRPSMQKPMALLWSFYCMKLQVAGGLCMVGVIEQPGQLLPTSFYRSVPKKSHLAKVLKGLQFQNQLEIPPKSEPSKFSLEQQCNRNALLLKHASRCSQSTSWPAPNSPNSLAHRGGPPKCFEFEALIKLSQIYLKYTSKWI